MTQVVYVAGHGFSGSTLLSFLLGAHPQMVTVGEVVIAPLSKDSPEAHICSCGNHYTTCRFWRMVSCEMKRMGFEFEVENSGLDFRAPDSELADIVLRATIRQPLLEQVRKAALLLPAVKAQLNSSLSRYEAFVEVLTKAKACECFVDSSKRAERALHLLNSRKLDVRVIHLVRDGRAVAGSAMKHWSYTYEQAAHSWVVDNEQCERLRSRFPPDRWLRVRYEDLCTNPEHLLREIHKFVGVEPKAPSKNFRAGQHIIGNNMRLNSTSEIILDEKWKTTMDPRHKAGIERILGRMNARYGYN